MIVSPLTLLSLSSYITVLNNEKDRIKTVVVVGGVESLGEGIPLLNLDAAESIKRRSVPNDNQPPSCWMVMIMSKSLL